jgi:hypothetical protein
MPARNLGVALGKDTLNFDCALDRVDGARELDERSISGRLEDAPIVSRGVWIEYLGSHHFEARQGSDLVSLHQA